MEPNFRPTKVVASRATSGTTSDVNACLNLFNKDLKAYREEGWMLVGQVRTQDCGGQFIFYATLVSSTGD